MKKKKNIIKKIELNKIYKLSYKKEFKHYLKESRFKDKFTRIMYVTGCVGSYPKKTLEYLKLIGLVNFLRVKLVCI